MRTKIINHAKKNYQSSPYEYSDEQINIIIESNCMCDYCGTSIFELQDFPEVLENERIVACEECYNEHHREWCSICGAYKDTDIVMGDCRCED